ncbi:unnamed protein product [Staurois parvus]|uniref:Uncharacterized protein n=1 Tax=Staurois parvus TaxID=386267 RepID=A0ABN9H8D1_9NEOB|nr:unnamed protein product [Staurois parvus]
MGDDRGIPSMNNLYRPYKHMTGMGQSLSPLTANPLDNGLGSIQNSQQSLHNYGQLGHNRIARGNQHLPRELATPPSAMMSHLNGMGSISWAHVDLQPSQATLIFQVPAEQLWAVG